MTQVTDLKPSSSLPSISISWCPVTLELIFSLPTAVCPLALHSYPVPRPRWSINHMNHFIPCFWVVSPADGHLSEPSHLDNLP